jgi:hypothetical protein
MPAYNKRFGERGGVALAKLLCSGKTVVCWASFCETPSFAKPPGRWLQAAKVSSRKYSLEKRVQPENAAKIERVM